MGLNSTLGSLLISLWMSEMWAVFAEKNCANYKLQFERVFSVPGEVAMLNSTLLSPDVLNFTAVPYNITWYNSKTQQEMSNRTGQILIVRETLWFLNTTLEDAGEYMMLLRTPSKCYMQSTMLVVHLPVSRECGRPNKTSQDLTNGVADNLNCPLGDYINKLNSYNIHSSLQWYKGCDPILDGMDGYTYLDPTQLTIAHVKNENSGIYTCTLTFTLGDVTGSVSETIDVTVTDEYSLTPQVHEPTSEIIRAEIGSNFTTRCLVFVPGVGLNFVEVIWSVSKHFIFTTDPTVRIYISKRLWTQHEPKGVWIERRLVISELREEDFNINYTCRTYSSRGNPCRYFTLLQPDPNLILPIGLVFGSVTVLFIISVIVYYIFRIDIVLGFRRTFPVLYTNKDLDGKLYDAYVTYPQHYTAGFSEEVEKFALHTLPEVLEKACGYKLFIAGRDCLPGQAIVDSVDENIKSSRRILLLYTASTFVSHRHTSSTSSNNNNVSKNSDDRTKSQSSDSSSMGLDGGEEVYSDTRQQLEHVTAMHGALMEGSLKVVLVELEEITPAQLALFPESVRHLRKKQGAVCWWKNLPKIQRRGTCVRWRRDGEKDGKDSPLSPSLCPSSRFWKEMRYHMPVRGKRAVSAEKTVLLNL